MKTKINIISHYWKFYQNVLHLSHTFEVLDKGGSCCRAPARAATFQVNAKCKSLFIHFVSWGLTISCHRGWISLLEISTGCPRSSIVVLHTNSERNRNLVRCVQFIWQYWNKEKRILRSQLIQIFRAIELVY